jgi:uncharacterized protein YjbI with pentapeptide repeats
MAKKNPGLKARPPKNVFLKPLKFEFKDLFKALAKGVGHTAAGKWEELATDAVETLSAVGLATDPEELAFLLIRRAAARALFELTGSSAELLPLESTRDTGALADQLQTYISQDEFYIDRRFLDRPTELPVAAELQQLLRFWLEGNGVSQPNATAISGRFPTYFVYALNQEWRQNSKSYRPLVEALDTPFTKASDRERGWISYAALLQRRIEESVFDEPFSLSQIYVSINAYYFDQKSKPTTPDDGARREGRPRIVVSLQTELEQWAQHGAAQDALRVISGGPGSGKSSFARMFAAALAARQKRVLFVPLHLIDPTKDLVEEVGRFVEAEGILPQNPLDSNDPEPNLTVIFDGLDELASQGKAAAETARAFVREVEKTLERRNLQSTKLRVLISGREVVVQENESEFRRNRQVLFLLPYSFPKQNEPSLHTAEEVYRDPENLLKIDLRQHWWSTYGRLTGKSYKGLPAEIAREDLDEITAQPLLNFLLALSFTRGKVDFSSDVNLNLIYADLVAAVYERGYEKHRPYAPIRHMRLDEFSRVLEEIGLAAWHGDGRTTTVREIEEHCRASGVGRLLDVFQEGAKAGITRLLAAFFFRQYGTRLSGDPTFVFTHKSFGEYLTARRLIRGVERIVRELERRSQNADEGWEEKDALKHWVLLCGPAALTTYLLGFLENEIKLRSREEVTGWQCALAQLFNYMLRHGTPMEQIPGLSFSQAMFQSRNAEEALLAVVSACGTTAKNLALIEPPSPVAFGAWLKRIQGQRSGPESILALKCLAYLDLPGSLFHMADLYRSVWDGSKLEWVEAQYANFMLSFLSRANLRKADLRGANLNDAHLRAANLQEANLSGANLELADLQGASLQGANLSGANLELANLKDTNLSGTNLRGANLKNANLEGTILAKRENAAPEKGNDAAQEERGD